MNKYVLPKWRKNQIFDDVFKIFAATAFNDLTHVLDRYLKARNVILIKYSDVPEGKRELLCRNGGQYGFVIPTESKEFLLFYNEKQSNIERRKTVWHELGHIYYEHKQESSLAEAEADFFMICAITIEQFIGGLAMSVQTKKD